MPDIAVLIPGSRYHVSTAEYGRYSKHMHSVVAAPSSAQSKEYQNSIIIRQGGVRKRYFYIFDGLRRDGNAT